MWGVIRTDSYTLFAVLLKDLRILPFPLYLVPSSMFFGSTPFFSSCSLIERRRSIKGLGCPSLRTTTLSPKAVVNFSATSSPTSKQHGAIDGPMATTIFLTLHSNLVSITSMTAASIISSVPRQPE